MALASGTRLGAYEIVALIGAGGMGEVYRARDTRLGRDVAIKVLPEAFTGDTERLARFKREAQVLASLNHAHIGAIYGLEETPSGNGLVLELVEGPTLADRIAQGPIPVGEALRIALQIAEALETAHERGIIHRDLKPANVKVRPDGTVKVLDFGLARSLHSNVAAQELTNSPTLTVSATNAGVLLGTAPYMSPEQAKGGVADARSDVFAFGAVLYEMLTGKRAFGGPTASEALASVLVSEPDLTRLPRNLSFRIRELVTRCLHKNVRQRWQAIGDVRVELEIAATHAEVASPAAPPGQRQWPRLAAAFVVAAVLATSVTWLVARRGSGSTPRSMSFAVNLPPPYRLITSPVDISVAIAPNGQFVVYRATDDLLGGPGSFSRSQLLVQRVGEMVATPIRGTETAQNPFVSPDSRWIGFFDGLALKRVALDGSAPVTICQYQGIANRGAAWGPDDTIVFATMTRLLSVSANGGEPKVIQIGKPGRAFATPAFPPGGRTLLFADSSGNRSASDDDSRIALLDLGTGAVKPLISGGSHPTYIEPGLIVYVAGGVLRAIRFDPETGTVSGQAFGFNNTVSVNQFGAANYGISRNGTLAYASFRSEERRTVAWMDRAGQEQPIALPPRGYFYPRLSPDGKRLALDVREQDNDIWIWDFARETLSRLTFTAARDSYPVWSPDGTRIFFVSARGGSDNIYVQSAEGLGEAQQLSKSDEGVLPYSVSPDGTRLLLRRVSPSTAADLAVLRLDVRDSPVDSLIATQFAELNGEISPDGKWVAYQSSESGTTEVYVRPFPNVNAGRWQVSFGGGMTPAWAKAASELFYVSNDAMMSVPFTTTSGFTAAKPTELFRRAPARVGGGRAYDVMPDGRRFVVVRDVDTSAEANLVVVLNWQHGTEGQPR